MKKREPLTEKLSGFNTACIISKMYYLVSSVVGCQIYVDIKQSKAKY